MKNLGHPAYPRSKGTGDHQHAGEAGAGDVSEPNAPQDPRGMVKAALLQVQSRSGHGRPRRYADSTRRHRVPRIRLLSSTNPYGEIPGDDPGRRDEWTT